MADIRDIRVQKLFLVTLVLKVGVSAVGWYLHDPVILGLVLPLLFMAAYIALGINRRDNEVSDEKFADSCYYLGFIFTITSIIFSLFDLPNIGTKIQDIAVRFGAAMISTVMGLGVRVYLINFKKDVADAIIDADEAVLGATQRFTEQLNMVMEKLRGFETSVHLATQRSVERVNVQVDDMFKTYAERLDGLFDELKVRNIDVLDAIPAEMEKSLKNLTSSVDDYSQALLDNLTGIKATVNDFTDSVTERLNTTTFPDDYFSKQLEGPLSQMTSAALRLATDVGGAYNKVNESTVLLSAALKKLNDRAEATSISLDTVIHLSKQQQQLLESGRYQVDVLTTIANNLSSLDAGFKETLEGIKSGNVATIELTQRVSGVIDDGVNTRRRVEEMLSDVIQQLQTQAQGIQAVVNNLHSSEESTKEAATTIAATLAANTAATSASGEKFVVAAEASKSVITKLETVALADLKAVQALNTIGLQTTALITKMDHVLEQFQNVARQLPLLDGRNPVSPQWKPVQDDDSSRLPTPAAVAMTRSISNIHVPQATGSTVLPGGSSFPTSSAASTPLSAPPSNTPTAPSQPQGHPGPTAPPPVSGT